MSAPWIVGLDLASRTGICYGPAAGPTYVAKVDLEPRKAASTLGRHAEPGCVRPGRLLGLLPRLVPPGAAAVAFVVEGAKAFSSNKGNGKAVGHGLRGVVEAFCYMHRYAFVEVPPAEVKRLATGKYDAEKPELRAAAIARLGVTLDDEDAVDALWLWRFGCVHVDAAGIAARVLNYNHHLKEIEPCLLLRFHPPRA